MKIAVASGKGGTGKTTVATGLAVTAARQGRSVHLVDCDVEAPNCHLFMQPNIRNTETIRIVVPEIETDRCTGCGLCVEACHFHALACVKERVVTFPELCHGCGTCRIVCPENCISEGNRVLGTVKEGECECGAFTQGRLRVGEAMARPLIRDLKMRANGADVVIYDAPPGTSCPAVETVRDTDYVILVSEPTPFGLSDLQLMAALLRQLGLSYGVVINRCINGADETKAYCLREGIPVLSEIAESRALAQAASRGCIAIDAVASLTAPFQALLDGVSAGTAGIEIS